MGCSCWGSEDSEQAESLFPLQIYEHAEYISPLGPKMGVRLPAPRLVGKTARKILEEIWDMLNESGPITVYGMAGAGKTAVMMNFYNQLLEAEGTGFDNFIFMSVRRYSEDEDENIRRWQDSLAHALNVELSVEQEVHERAKILHKAVNSIGHLLIIMDDVSFGFSINHVIWHGYIANQIVLVSRFREAAGWSDGRFVWVDLLSEKEALKLFVEKVNTELTPKMQDLIDDIVKECACLPLIIVAVAGALRGKEDIFWREALHKLRYSAKGMMDTQGTMYKSLKFDWDQLPGRTRKERFLYCVLYPKHWGILQKELTDYWPMVGMVYQRRSMIRVGRGDVYVPQRDFSFKNVGVDFEDCHEWGEGLKMHRLYRDFALLTANQRFMSKCGQKLKELPDGSEWGENLEGASFMCNNITSIAVSPRCPQLQTLFLNQNPDLCSIARSFFVHMHGLKILDMRDNARLKSLPNSLSNLVTLQALRMSRCSSLKKVPSLAILTLMEILEFDDTAIEELPHGIDVYFKLRVPKLRVLKLHSLRLRKPIPNWFLSSLHLLPQLDLQM